MTTEPWAIKQEDLDRWKGQKRAILGLLSDGKVHSRVELEQVAGAIEPASRVSELRSAGYVIACTRVTGDGPVMTYYQLKGKIDGDATRGPKQCPNCGHQL